MNQIQTFEKFLDREKNIFDGGHSIRTPFELVRQITNQLDIVKNDTILVYYNVEFVIDLVYNKNVDPNTISFLSDHTNKDKLIKRTGDVKILKKLDNSMKFDIVIGNPPYQEREDTNKNSTNTSDLAFDFVKKSFSISRKYIALILPSDWVGPNESAMKKKLFKEYKLKNLSFYGQKWFKVKKNTCSFIYEKGYNDNCLVEDVNGFKNKFNLNNFNLLSHENKRSIFLNKFDIKNNIGEMWNRGKLHLNQIKKKTKGKEFIEAVGRKNASLTITNIGNNETCGFGREGIVIGNLGTSKSIENIKFKEKNQVGGHSVVFLLTETRNQAMNLKKYLESKLIRYLVNSIKTSSPNSKSLFKLIPSIDFNKSYTDNELYKIFNISKEEMQVIDSEYADQ